MPNLSFADKISGSAEVSKLAARSTSVSFSNSTRHTTLLRVGWGLDHGEWDAEPPDEVGPQSNVSWGSESSGFLTGTEGWVRYYPLPLGSPIVPSPVPDEETIYIHWDNPYAGSNSYSFSAPPPYAVTQNGDGSGDNAQVGFVLGGAYGPDTCQTGYVWRGANDSDHVCVSPATRDQTAADNSLAASRVDPAGGPYGPDTCLQGYVWREAFPGDHVCVTPETRAQAQADNADAGNRVL